jgi:TonB-dependent SusC/RagA subfamily outer membrane receptor
LFCVITCFAASGLKISSFKPGNMKPIIIIAVFIFTIATNLFAGEEKNIVPSILKSAIVYRNGAELSHTAKATLRQGNSELIIEDISNAVDVNSVQVHCSDAITIMSVEFSTEYLKPELRSPSVKKMEDSVIILQKEFTKLEVLVKSDNELMDLLRANKEIRGTQSGLSVAELMKMMDYYKQKSLELQNELSSYKEKETKLTEIITKLQSAIEEEQKKNNKTSGKLLLQLLSATAGTFDFTVSYLTPTAFWNPSYDIRVDNINNPLKLLYKAKLVQTSGIDWKQVKLSLSTSVPSQNGNAPILKTWFLKYIDPVLRDEDLLKSNTIQSFEKAPAAQLNEVVITGYGTKKNKATDDNEDPLYIVNGKPTSIEEFGKIDQRVIKNINVLKEDKAKSLYGSRAANGAIIVTLKDELGDYVSVNDNQLNVVFDIDIPYDVPANGKEKHVVLKEYTVPVLYKYYAVPKLDNDAYLLSEVREWEKLNLLPGEANIIFEGTYVGKTYIDPNSTLDTLNLTLGKDKRVVVKREKITDYSSVKFLGTNKKQIFTYEITVKNNKKEKIQMLLKDQYPISSTKEIEAELLESSNAAVNEETGVLTWKLELQPNESKKFRISYSVKYPKEKTVNTN